MRVCRVTAAAHNAKPHYVILWDQLADFACQ